MSSGRQPGLTERSLLRLGQEIVIPAKAASAEAPASEAPAEAAAPKVHVIESGDNLLYLAEKCGVTVAQILAVNPDLTERSILRLGQEVIIPTQAPEASVPTPAPEPTATPEPQFIEHSIESGDTLGYLASKYDTTVDDILAANPGMTEWTVLRLGQIVRVPAPPQSGGPDPEPTPEPVAEATATPEPAALAAATASTASLMSMGGPAQPRALEPLSPRGGAWSQRQTSSSCGPAWATWLLTCGTWYTSGRWANLPTPSPGGRERPRGGPLRISSPAGARTRTSTGTWASAARSPSPAAVSRASSRPALGQSPRNSTSW